MSRFNNNILSIDYYVGLYHCLEIGENSPYIGITIGLNALVEIMA